MNLKYKRTNFLDGIDVGGILEKDFLKNYFDLFNTKRPPNIFTITRDFIGRPDLLSIVNYNNVDFWWIIGKYNQIDDWWNDINVGDIIYIPSIYDIEDWFFIVKSKQSSGI